MFKGILILLFIGLITVFVIVMVVLSLLRGAINKVKQMLGMREYPDEDEYFGSRFGRKNQQYYYHGGSDSNGGGQGGNGGSGSHSGNGGSDSGQGPGYGDNKRRSGAGNNVVDMRDNGSQHRKIFSKDEGEYVNYEEVDE